MYINNNKETQIPFQGFYNTIWCSDYHYPTDGQGDNIDDGELENEQAYCLMVCEKYTELMCDLLADKLNCEDTYLKFTMMSSPQFYNYNTERIFADIDDNTVNLLRAYAHSKDKDLYFSQYLVDNFKSRDGFHSYYPYQIDQWFTLDYDELDHNHIHTYITFFLVQNCSDYDIDIYYAFDDTLTNYCYEHYQYEYENLLNLLAYFEPNGSYKNYQGYKEIENTDDVDMLQIIWQCADSVWASYWDDIPKVFDHYTDLYKWCIENILSQSDYYGREAIKDTNIILNWYDSNGYIIGSVTN